MVWILVLLTSLVGCNFSDAVQHDIDKYTQVAAEKEGLEASQAMARLVQIGRRSIPTIELALQQAPPTGKRNLVVVLRRIGEVDVVSLLQHLAIHDSDPIVRSEARNTLEAWAKGPGDRGDKARAALRKIDEMADRQETG